MLHTYTLSGGLRLLVEELPHTHSVSIGCFIGVGAAHEQRPTCGISHFLEHMLFKGTERRPTPKQISDAIEAVNSILDAYTGFESTVYFAKVANIHFDRALDVLSDMLLHPRMMQRDIEKERKVIIEELHETEDAPAELVHTLLDLGMWGDQPLGRDIAGDEASVLAITRDDVVRHWETYYTRGNMVISIAGNIAAETARAAVEQAFADMREGTPFPYIASTPPRPGPQITLRYDDSEQGNWSLGFPGLATSDPDRRGLMVLDTVLGGGASSRLFQQIREERGLAYTVGSYSRNHHDIGKWVVYGSVEPERLEECLTTTLHELRQAREHGITEEELQQVKEQVKGGILLSLEDTWSVASRNGSHTLRYGRVVPVEQVVADVEAVTRDDVLRAAARVLREDQMHLAVIGPYDDTTPLLDALLADTVSEQE